jgi:hypothetical protein
MMMVPSMGATAMQNDAQVANQVSKSGNVTFYKVPLECPAAPAIGCGSRAKPVLLDLESKPIVKEAWLDRQGKILAIVWKEATAGAGRTAVIVALRKTQNLSVEELTGGSRDAALQNFRSSGGWHRGADVDRLSEEEAGVIADRLMRRVIAKVPTISSKAELLQPIMADIIRDYLVGSPDPSSAQRRETFRDDLLAAVGNHLSRVETDALLEATKVGFRPVAGER